MYEFLTKEILNENKQNPSSSKQAKNMKVLYLELVEIGQVKIFGSDASVGEENQYCYREERQQTQEHQQQPESVSKIYSQQQQTPKWMNRF